MIPEKVIIIIIIIIVSGNWTLRKIGQREGRNSYIYIDTCPVSNSNNDNNNETKAGKGCRNNCKKNIYQPFNLPLYT